MNLHILLAQLPSVTEGGGLLDPRKNEGTATFKEGGGIVQTFLNNGIHNILIYFFGLCAVLSFVYGGILYITAGGDAEKAEKGKRVIIYSVIAIVIMMLVLVVYNFVIRGTQTGQV